jgi:hypothetical protein
VWCSEIVRFRIRRRMDRLCVDVVGASGIAISLVDDVLWWLLGYKGWDPWIVDLVEFVEARSRRPVGARGRWLLLIG